MEAIEAGVFRSDLKSKFSLDTEAITRLMNELDITLQFALEVEGGIPRDKCTNFDEIKEKIMKKLEGLRDVPKRKEHPVIYHLDVGAMYPNIILTNRMQPSAVVTEEDCAACVYNRPENNW